MKTDVNPIAADELIYGLKPRKIIQNKKFSPSSEAQQPIVNFEGALKVEGTFMEAHAKNKSNNLRGKNVSFFPGVTIDFFTLDKEYLVPATQEVIPNGTLDETQSYWDIIIQPGQIWNEPSEGEEWNYASFPFSLVNRLEGESHIGIAMFLYNERAVSYFRFQIVAQTAPFDVSGHFRAVGVSNATYNPGAIKNKNELAFRFQKHKEKQFQTAPFNNLKQKVNKKDIKNFSGMADASDGNQILQYGLYYKNILYLSPCNFAGGPFPYSKDLRYGVWSITKTAVMNVAMLRLAKKYGKELLYEKIADYIDISYHQTSWSDVTFLDLANMASGRGATQDDPTCYLCDYHRWYLARSMKNKVLESLNYPQVWQPGTKYNYRDQDAFLLGIALEKYIRAKEGRKATIKNMLSQEVFEQIGIYYSPVNNTIESDEDTNYLRMDFGYYATLDELTKIALLFENQGNWDGKQILHEHLIDDILPKSKPPKYAIKKDVKNEYGPKYYVMNWHVEPFLTSEDSTIYIPNMKGYGGNLVTMMPNKLIGLRMANSTENSEKFDSTIPQARVANKLDAFSEIE